MMSLSVSRRSMFGMHVLLLFILPLTLWRSLFQGRQVVKQSGDKV